MEPAKTAHTVVVVAAIHDWLLLHSGKHVHLRLLLLLLLRRSSITEEVLIARVKSSLPLVGLVLLLHAKLSAHAEGRLLLLGLLLLLLQGAIEELGLEAARARGGLLGWHLLGEEILRLLRGRLLLLLLEHLHLLHLGLALLHWIVPVAHDLEGGVLRVRGVRLRVLLHHVHQVVNHILLLVLLRLSRLRLSLTCGWSPFKLAEAVICCNGIGRNEIAELVIL